jgi:hypothetical protein
MAKRRGRPLKAPELRRSEVFGVRLTAREADRVHRFARRHGVSSVAVIRAAVALFFEREAPRR